MHNHNHKLKQPFQLNSTQLHSQHNTMMIKFWKRKQQQQERSLKRDSSSTAVTATEGQASFSSDDINNTWPLHRDAAGERLDESQKTTRATGGGEPQDQEESSSSVDQDYYHDAAAAATPTTTNQSPKRSLPLRWLGPAREMSTSSVSVLTNGSTANTTTCANHHLSTREVLEASRREREESIAKGLAVLQGMEQHAKQAWRKRMGEDNMCCCDGSVDESLMKTTSEKGTKPRPGITLSARSCPKMSSNAP